jgi:hypothetical protein
MYFFPSAVLLHLVVTSQIFTAASYSNVTRHGPLPALISCVKCTIPRTWSELSLCLQACIYHVTAGRVNHHFLSPEKYRSAKSVTRDATRLAESECDCSLNEQRVWINAEGKSWGVRLQVIQATSFILSQKEEATVLQWTAWYNNTP